MKNRQYIIEIRVHPLVSRWLKNNYPCEDSVFDLLDSFDFAITGMLVQSNVIMPSRVGKNFETFTPIKLYISEFDFSHYGYQVSELQQCRFSRFLYSFILERACWEILYRHIYIGVPKEVAIRNWLAANVCSDSELTYDNLRKYYQRKFQNIEKKQKEATAIFVKNVQKRYKIDTKICVQIVPDPK